MTMPAPLRRSPDASALTITRSCSIWIWSLASCTGPMVSAMSASSGTRGHEKAPRCWQVGGPTAPRGCTRIRSGRARRYVPATPPPNSLERRSQSDLGEQITAEMRHGERDLAALRGEHQTLRHEAVARGRKGRREPLLVLGDARCADGLVPA